MEEIVVDVERGTQFGTQLDSIPTPQTGVPENVCNPLPDWLGANLY